MITETMLFLSGIQFVIHFFLYHAGVKTHFRVSSMPAGTPSPPGIFTLVEDIVAVDGGGGTRFREEWKARYEASPLFRRMLNRLDAFWGFGALLAATVLTVMLWTIPIVDVYWIGEPLRRSIVDLISHDTQDGLCHSCGRACGLF